MMPLVETVARYLHGTRLSWAVAGGYPWIWPLCETLHFIGMGLLVGIVGVLDLRMLGVAKQLAPGPFERLIPWAIGGFVINLTTGFLFFTGDPSQYIHNTVFWLKLLFIILAGINALAFYVTGIVRQVDALGPGDDAPWSAKAIAATSLVLWIGVIYWGRMLPFLGGAF
jgi:hypothetical protein